MGYFTREELEKMDALPKPGDRLVVGPTGSFQIAKTGVDYNDHETMIRRWAIEQAIKVQVDPVAIIELAKTIEAYVKGEK